jgi:hypothetical protein
MHSFSGFIRRSLTNVDTRTKNLVRPPSEYGTLRMAAELVQYADKVPRNVCDTLLVLTQDVTSAV